MVGVVRHPPPPPAHGSEAAGPQRRIGTIIISTANSIGGIWVCIAHLYHVPTPMGRIGKGGGGQERSGRRSEGVGGTLGWSREFLSGTHTPTKMQIGGGPETSLLVFGINEKSLTVFDSRVRPSPLAYAIYPPPQKKPPLRAPLTQTPPACAIQSPSSPTSPQPTLVHPIA